MAIIKNPLTLIIQSGGENNDLDLFMDTGTLYDLLDDYTVQQIMTGNYALTT